MKKTLFYVCASLITSLPSDAQTMKPNEPIHPLQFSLSNQSLSFPNPTCIALEQGEHLMGFYTTDDLPTASISFGMKGDYEVGAAFPIDLIGSFATGQISKIRFALGEAFGTSTVSIYEINEKDQLSAPVATSQAIKTTAGWNEVSFTKPITIKENTRYFFAYTYKEVKAAQKSILLDKDINPNGNCDGGLWAKYGNDWVKQPATFGNLAIQVVVKGGKFIDYDLAVNQLQLNKWNKQGEKTTFSFSLQNRGNKLPQNATFTAAIDGKPIDIHVSLPTTLIDKQEIEGSFIVPNTLEGRSHQLAITIATIDGNKPEKNTSDDTTSSEFLSYKQAMKRHKNLIELLTSQYSGICPIGNKVLNDVSQIRNDLALIAIHQDVDNNARDEFTIPSGNQIAMVLSCGGMPAIAVNRFFNKAVNPSESLSYFPVVGGANNYEEASANLNALIDQVASNVTPAFATIDIQTIYNKANHKLHITVSGETTNDAQEIYGNHTTLTVVLTENNLKARQANGEKWKNDYIHNNVLREVVTIPAGDALNWTSTTSYKNTYETTLEESWNPENMHIIAFISPSFQQIDKLNSLSVSNANQVTLLNPSSISQENLSEFPIEIARFTIDGRRISQPTQGINLVRMSDGTTRKEFVK